MISAHPELFKLKRPALRYHGGKWLLAKWLISLFPEHRVYVEPFGGAASVLLQKARVYSEVYNDLGADVVNLFTVLRDPIAADELRRRLELTAYARDEFFACYKAGGSPVEIARRMIVRSFMGFGSASAFLHYKTGFRSNSNRSGTTPAHDWVNYPKHLLKMTERLQGVIIENRDFRKLIPTHDSTKTLFYVDPPYLQSTRTSEKCYPHEMTNQDHEDLAWLLHRIKGKALLSGYPSDLYSRLYKDWSFSTRKSMADGARVRTEVVWANYELPKP